MLDSVRMDGVGQGGMSAQQLAFANSGAAMAQLSRYTEDLRHLMRVHGDTLRQLESAHVTALTLLSRAAEYRDDETGVHMDRVGLLAQLMARLIGRSESEAGMIRVAAPMHDIGKIAIPDAILKKPGPYNAEERRIMNEHTVHGASILGQSDIPVFRLAAEVALTHHESWDGSGYPRGVSGARIPWSGRVVTLIDFFDALTMDRVYRKAFSDEQALRMVADERGRKFDPELVDVFLAHADEFIAIRDEVNAAARGYAALIRHDADDIAYSLGLEA